MGPTEPWFYGSNLDRSQFGKNTYLSWVSLIVSVFSLKSSLSSDREKCLSTFCSPGRYSLSFLFVWKIGKVLKVTNLYYILLIIQILSLHMLTIKMVKNVYSQSTTALLRPFLWVWRWKIFSSIEPVVSSLRRRSEEGCSPWAWLRGRASSSKEVIGVLEIVNL